MFLSPTIVRAILSTIPAGQFFSVRFETKSGSSRAMLAQVGVHKHVKGTGRRSYNPDIQVVYEKDVVGYRSFDVNRVYSLKTQGSLVEALQARVR